MDTENKGGWEAVSYKLATLCGIKTAPFKAQIFSGKHHTFLTKRFDRAAKGKRIHFASAMTMLQKKDGDDASSGVSYLEIVEFLIRFGAKPKEDLEELWKRIVFLFVFRILMTILEIMDFYSPRKVGYFPLVMI